MGFQWYATINSVNVESIISATLDFNGSYRSSRFELTASISHGPLGNLWWSSLEGSLPVEVFLRSQPSGSDVLLFSGLADGISLDPIRLMAYVHGRDYSSLLASCSYQASFLNRTASEIATDIAKRHGLDTEIETTTPFAGSFQRSDHNQMVLNAHSRVRSEWDVLVLLAKREALEFFIDGRTLVFASLDYMETSCVPISYGDVTGMKFHKGLRQSDETRLIVKSWNTWQNRSFSQEGLLPGGNPVPGPAGVGNVSESEIALMKPNLNPSDIGLVAQRYQESIMKNRLRVDIAMPGGLTPKVHDTLEVNGTGTAFDTNFIVSSLRCNLSPTTGFTRYISAYSVVPRATLST